MKKQEYQERRRIINMADRLEFKKKQAGNFGAGGRKKRKKKRKEGGKKI